MRTRDPAGKRRALLAAGGAVAEEQGLSGLKVDLVVAEAGVAKGSFFHLFGDRAAYLTQLHQEFHDRILADVDTAIAGRRPGRERLVAGTLAYLDGCRRQRGTRALLADAQGEPATVRAVATRNEQGAALAEPDFAALGHRHPDRSAQLWVVLAREVAICESAARAELPDLREALIGYLDR